MKTLFKNAKVYVERDCFEEAVYQEDGIIKAVGSYEDLKAIAPEDAEIVDCGGKLMLPGFNDSHFHIITSSAMRQYPRLAECRSPEEIIATCRKYIEDHPNCSGIMFQGWDDENWVEGSKKTLDKTDMDKISDTLPVLLRRICGHSCAVNSVVLKKMGLYEEAYEIPGGEIRIGEDGRPDGFLMENAMIQAQHYMPKMSVEECKDFLRAGFKYGIEHGLTSYQSHDYGFSPEEDEIAFKAVKELTESGECPIRYRAQVGCFSVEDVEKYINGPWFNKEIVPGHMEFGPVKILKDGSLGARSALMREEYKDDPGNFGKVALADDLQLAIVKYANGHGAQVACHCIGDGAISRTLDAFEQGNPDLRNVIVHCQITDKALLERIAEDNVLVSYQPVFLEYDIHTVEPRVGKELASASYAFKTAEELGIHSAYGSDAPAEDFNPMCGIYCAITRKDYNGFPEGGWNPQECLDVATVVDNYTLGSAYQEFKENYKGRIKPGFLADLVVLDTDIFTASPEEILNAKSVRTVIGGETVYSIE